jgi:hypothetical protein
MVPKRYAYQAAEPICCFAAGFLVILSTLPKSGAL